MTLPLENCQYLGFQIARWADLVVGETDRRQPRAATPAAPEPPAGAAPVPPMPRGAAVMLCLLDPDLAPAALAAARHDAPQAISFLVIFGARRATPAARPVRRDVQRPVQAAAGFDPNAPLPPGQTAPELEALWRNFHAAAPGPAKDTLLRTLLLTYWPMTCRVAREAR